MLNNKRTRIYLALVAVIISAIIALIWHFADQSSRLADASDTNLRDLPDSMDSHSTSRSSRLDVPLAAIPWKRGDDTFTAISLAVAKLPWNRELGAPTDVTLASAELPWKQRRMDSYTPVFLDVCDIPWRH
jgi:hypothetical protein